MFNFKLLAEVLKVSNFNGKRNTLCRSAITTEQAVIPDNAVCNWLVITLLFDFFFQSMIVG